MFCRKISIVALSSSFVKTRSILFIPPASIERISYLQFIRPVSSSYRKCQVANSRGFKSMSSQDDSNMSDGKLSSPEKDASPSSPKVKPKRLTVKLEDIIPWSKTDASDAADTAAPEGVDSDDPTTEPQLQPYSYIPELNDKVSIYKGDITKLQIDAIVNAANESLLGGGGVDGAIHEAGGDELTDECETLNGCAPGDAKITGGYRLPAKHVIHTVGPRKETEEVLSRCYERCFQIFLENELKSIAFPCISTGIFGYPNDKAAHVALKQARTFLEQHHDKVDRVIFCVFLKKDLGIYEELLELYFPRK